jgi:hypothetical protein
MSKHRSNKKIKEKKLEVNSYYFQLLLKETGSQYSK